MAVHHLEHSEIELLHADGSDHGLVGVLEWVLALDRVLLLDRLDGVVKGRLALFAVDQVLLDFDVGSELVDVALLEVLRNEVQL